MRFHPLGHAIQRTSPNNLLLFDYVEIDFSLFGEKYVLMIRDDSSSYCLFCVCADTTLEFSSKAIISWCAAFGFPEMFLVDGIKKFENETKRLDSKERMSHTS